jgi:hypothetical protein
MSLNDGLTSAIFDKGKEDSDRLLDEAFRGFPTNALLLAVRISVSAALLKGWAQGFARGLAMGRAAQAMISEDRKTP